MDWRYLHSVSRQLDALRDASWTRSETLGGLPVHRSDGLGTGLAAAAGRLAALHFYTNLFPSPLAFVTETEMSYMVLVDRVSRAPSPIQGIPERLPYVDPRMLHAHAPGHCAWLLGVGPAQPLCVPVYHYPRGGVREVGSGPAKTRRSPPHPKRWCPSRGFKTRSTTVLAVPPQLGSVTHGAIAPTSHRQTRLFMFFNTHVTDSKASPLVQKLLSCLFRITRQQLLATLQDC